MAFIPIYGEHFYLVKANTIKEQIDDRLTALWDQQEMGFELILEDGVHLNLELNVSHSTEETSTRSFSKSITMMNKHSDSR